MYRPVCGWDFSLLKSPSMKRSVSPKVEDMPATTMSRINLRVTNTSNRDNSNEKIKAEPIKILDEEDQQRFFLEQTKIREKLGNRRAKENNLSLIPDIIMEENAEKEKDKETRRRKPVNNSFCHFPNSDFTKILKAGFISPVRNVKIDCVPKREITKNSPVQTVKKRVNSQNMATRPSVKQEKSQVSISTEHKKDKKSMEIMYKKILLPANFN